MNREEMILNNQKLVGFIINKHYSNRLDLYDDLFQEGLIGLINAIDRFGDSSDFVNIAYTCIKNRMYDYIKKLSKFPTMLDINSEEVHNSYSEYLSYDVNLDKVITLNSIKEKLNDKEFKFVLNVMKGYKFRIATEKVGFKRSHSPIMIKNVKRKLNIK